MRIIIEKDYGAVSKKAALLVASQVTIKPDSVLGLATGSTPLGMYKELIAMYQQEEIDFSEVTTFNLDEYYRLPHDNPHSYHYYMNNEFFSHVDIKESNIFIPDGTVDDINKECNNYERKIMRSGGIDLQVLGIGSNGHIGFNEPRDTLNVSTGLVSLSEKTIIDNSRFFSSLEKVPKKAVTMGMATILKASRILLLASGKGKAEAIQKTVSGYISTWTPSSLLQTHSEVTLIIDQDAASLIDS
ncbi:MAG: glucosamine-6-phosphate deaminase [Halanaerobiaceae bacterium]